MIASLVLVENTLLGYVMVELFSQIKSVTALNHKEVQTSNKLFYSSNVDYLNMLLNGHVLVWRQMF